MASVGPVTIVFDFAKEVEKNQSAYFSIADTILTAIYGPSAASEDRDYDSYRGGAIFNFKGNNFAGEAGGLFIYNRNAAGRQPFGGQIITQYVLQPYFKAKVGPLALQGEINYMWGEWDYENTRQNQRIDQITAFLDGDANFGMFSVGGSFAYVQGDSNNDVVKNAMTGGRDWDPCLIMFNNTTANSWIGGIGTYAGAGITGEMSNAWFGQLRGGVTPIPQLNTGLSVSYAAADKIPQGFSGSYYGWEVDVTGTYKITNNLSYMLGLGYLHTGDFWKGVTDTVAGANNSVKDDYLLINKLTLSF